MKNVGNLDRIFRTVAALAFLVVAFVAPLPLFARIIGMGGMAAYLAATALAGTCLGYRMMGMSTCPIKKAH